MTTGRCWYCGGAGRELTDEHVLSEANFGGRLVAPQRVCGDCNGEVGKLERAIVAGPFLAELLARDQHLFAPRGLPKPLVEGVLGDRSSVRVRFETEDAAQIVSRKPRKIGEDDDGTEVWEASADDAELVRQRREAKGNRVRVIGRDPADGHGLNTTWAIGEANIDYWPRFGAKVALSLASLTLDEAWLDTDGARALQAVLARYPVPSGLLGKGLQIGPTELAPDEDPVTLLRPGEHVLGLDRDDRGRPRAWLILFASVAYCVPLPDADVPDAEPTWLLRPNAAACGPVPGAQLRQQLEERAKS